MLVKRQQKDTRFSIMEMNLQEAKEFAQAINDVHEKITHCRICGNLSEKDKCEILL